MVTQQEIQAKAALLTADQRAAINKQLSGMSAEDLAKRKQSPQVNQTRSTSQTSPVTPVPTNPVETTVQQPTPVKVETPVTPVETPKVEAPKADTPTVAKTPAAPEVPTPITKDTSWSDVKDKSLTNLEQLVESRYGTIATQQNGKLTATVGDKKYEWSLDAQGNPVKTEIQGDTTPEMQAAQSPENIYSSLLQGIPVDKNLPGYSEAQKRYDKYKKYSSYDQEDFEVALGDGTLLPGTQLYNDLTQDPAIKLSIDKAQALNRLNGVSANAEDIFAAQSDEIGNSTKVNINGETTTIAKALEDGYISQEEYNSFTNTPEVIAKVEEVQALSDKRDALQTAYDNVEDDVREQLKGTGATESQILSMAGMRQENMLPGLNLAITKANNAIGALAELKAINTDLFATNMDLYSQKEEREYNQSVLEEQRAYNEAQTTQQLEQQYQYTYGDLNSENPTLQNIAIQNAVAQMYENYPLPGLESQTTKVQKVQNLIAQGMTGSEALAQVESEIRNSQRYKDYIASQAPQAEVQKPFTVSAGSSVYDPATGEFKSASGNVTSGGALGDLRGLAGDYPNQAWAKNNNPAGITWNSNFENGKGTAALFDEAGINYSKGTSRPAAEGGNYVTFATIEDGLKAQRILMSGTYGNSTVGQMLQSWVGTSEGPNYAKQVAGNAGIDTGVKVSDLSDIELAALQSAKIQKESPGLYDLLEKQTQAQEVEGFKTDAEAQYINYLQTGKIGTNTAELEAIESEFGSIENFRRQAENYNNSENGPRQKELDKIVTIKDQVAGLLSEDNQRAIDNSTGTVQTALRPATRREREAYLANVQNFLDGKTLQQLIDVKDDGATFGALSNEELKLLQNSASKLNQLAIRAKDAQGNRTGNIVGFRGSTENYKKVLQETVNTYNSLIAKKQNIMGNTPEENASTQTNTFSSANGKVYEIK